MSSYKYTLHDPTACNNKQEYQSSFTCTITAYLDRLEIEIITTSLGHGEIAEATIPIKNIISVSYGEHNVRVWENFMNGDKINDNWFWVSITLINDTTQSFIFANKNDAQNLKHEIKSLIL